MQSKQNFVTLYYTLMNAGVRLKVREGLAAASLQDVEIGVESCMIERQND